MNLVKGIQEKNNALHYFLLVLYSIKMLTEVDLNTNSIIKVLKAKLLYESRTSVWKVFPHWNNSLSWVVV